MEATKTKFCSLCGGEGHTATHCKWGERLPQAVAEACTGCEHPGDCERIGHKGCERLAALAGRLRATLAVLEPRRAFVIMREELRLAAGVARRAGWPLHLVSVDDNWATLSLTGDESEQIGAMVKFIS